MSALGDTFQPPCGMCGAAWTPDHRCPTPTPRIARSIDDLRVGQWAIYRVGEDDWTGPFRVADPRALWHAAKHPVLILADPPAPPTTDWLVPGEAIEALREACDEHNPLDCNAYDAARAVLDAAKEQTP